MHKKILVVDDDYDILDAIKLVLESEGYMVLTISRGEDTYKKVIEFQPDIILLDVLISGIDGRIICKTLKNDKYAMFKPIIMISAHPSTKIDSFRYGANDFLEKPFEIEELLTMIERHLH